MAADHTRPLPVAPERLDHLSWLIHDRAFTTLSAEQLIEIMKLALQGELIEQQQQTNFFLQEAYDIYNARFR